MIRPVLLLFLTILCSFRAASHNETDKMIMQAVEGQLPVLLSKIQPGDEQRYGFTESDDLDDCVPGKPYRIITFSDKFYNDDLDVNNNYIVMKNEWRVPVKISGKNRNLLTLAGNPGNYVITSMGDTLLAQQLQQVSFGIDSTDAFYLLRIPRLHADFVGYETNNSFAEVHFIPLPSAIAAIHSLDAGKKVYTLMETEQLIKNALDNKVVPAAKTSAPGKNSKRDKPKRKPKAH